MKTARIDISINLAQSDTNRNYLSSLTCLVEAQEAMREEIIEPITLARSKSESEREGKVFLKTNKKKHWSEI